MPDREPVNLDFSISTNYATDDEAANFADDFLSDEPIVPTTKKPEETPKTEPKETPKEPTDEEVKEEILGKDEEETDETKEEDGEDKQPEGVDFNSIAEELFIQGIFTKDEGETDVVVDTPEALLERFQYEKKKEANNIIENFLSKFGDDYIDAFENIFVNGVNPRDYYKGQIQLEDLSQADLTVPETQKTVIRQSLKLEGFSDDYINKRIQKLEEYADLEDEAKSRHEILLKKQGQEQENLKLQKQQEELAKAQRKKDNVAQVSKVLQTKLQSQEFDGIPVTKEFAQKVGTYLTSDKFSLKGGETITEFEKDLMDLRKPENSEFKVKVAMLLQLLKEDPTLSKIQKTGVSKETNALFSKIKKATNKTSTPDPKKKKDEEVTSWFK